MFRISIVVLVLLCGDGYSQEEPEPAHFHHVHLNVTDSGNTIRFYERYLSAVRVKYRGMTDALFTERSFILLNRVSTPPRSAPATSLMHIGWAGVDGPNEYEWLKREGVEFETPATPLGRNYYMYFYGKDRELLEIFTGEQNHRFNHVHLWAKDVNVTTQWFIDVLGLPARQRTRERPEDPNRRWSNGVRSDNVGIVIFGLPEKGQPRRPERMPDEFEPTKGSVIDHIAFSYRDIEPEFDRMQGAGVEIVSGIREDPQYGHKSFFVMAPGNLLVEIVEDKPIPEGIWD